MPVRLTKEEFIKRSINKHGNKYKYDKSIYVNNNTKIIITCTKHGDFLQIPHHHMNRSGCLKCAGKHKYTTSEYIEKAIKKHNSFYNYSLTNYINADSNITIICPIHGIFEQIAGDHLRGNGCPTCRYIKSGNSNRHTKDIFISKAKKIHGDKYNYENVEYKSSETKVVITCLEHGDFLMTPNNHTSSKQGCPTCGIISNGLKQRKTLQQFIDESNKVHNYKYNYSKTQYKTTKDKVLIICPNHGEFEQSALHHIQGRGCSKCGDLLTALKTKKPLHYYIDKANSIHGFKYKYHKVIHKNQMDKITITCNKHGDFEMSFNTHIGQSQGCPRCNSYRSKAENYICDFIRECGHTIEEDQRINSSLKRYDCIIPTLKIAVEFNGNWHHKVENKNPFYHFDKRSYAEQNGYRLYSIWEHEWNINKTKILNQLKNILNGKEKLKTGKTIKINLDKEFTGNYKYLGYQIISIMPEPIILKNTFCYNSGIAILQKTNNSLT